MYIYTQLSTLQETTTVITFISAFYLQFHADIAPIGGHDGYNEPSANGDFHYLHHSKYECNYGVHTCVDRLACSDIN